MTYQNIFVKWILQLLCNLEPIYGGIVIGLSVIIDCNFFTFSDWSYGPKNHGHRFKILLPVGVRREGMVVNRTVAEDQRSSAGASPRIDVVIKLCSFQVFSFFGCKCENGAIFDHVAHLKIFEREYAAALLCNPFDYNEPSHEEIIANRLILIFSDCFSHKRNFLNKEGKDIGNRKDSNKFDGYVCPEGDKCMVNVPTEPFVPVCDDEKVCQIDPE